MGCVPLPGVIDWVEDGHEVVGMAEEADISTI
jgi:hypothetical protein